MPDDVKLRECPFCGGEAEMETLPEEWESEVPRFCVICSKCGAAAPSRGRTEAEAIAAWNTRPDPSEQDVERIQQALQAVVDAIREYLIPDGISQEELVDRVIGATDCPEIVPVIARMEARAAINALKGERE